MAIGRILIVTLGLLAGAVPAVAADSTPVGMLEASSLEALPPAAPMRVQPLANSALERDLVGVFQAALEAAGYPLREQGAYVLGFRLTGEVERERAQSRLQLEGQGGSQNTEDVAVTLRFKAGSKPKKRGERDQLLLVSVSDPGGHVMWEGRVTFLAAGQPTFETVETIVPSLVGEIGREVLSRQLP